MESNIVAVERVREFNEERKEVSNQLQLLPSSLRIEMYISVGQIR